jgi:hypothetical protein
MSITRRSFVAGLSLSTATIAAASAAPAVPDTELSSMVIDGRRVSVDTMALPETFLVTHEDEGAGGWTERLSHPEAGEYVVMTWEGDLRITPLVDGHADKSTTDRRVGFMLGSAEGYPPGTIVRDQVRVIGKVV